MEEKRKPYEPPVLKEIEGSAAATQRHADTVAAALRESLAEMEKSTDLRLKEERAIEDKRRRDNHRDTFAMRAMQALIHRGTLMSYRQLAEAAYSIADAMLDVRGGEL